jgi:hypothetical protein
MCELAVFIVQCVLGVIALINGRIYLTRQQVVEGAPARAIGIVLLLSALLFAAGNVFFFLSLSDPATRLPVWFIIVVWCLIPGGVLLAVIIGVATARRVSRRTEETAPTREAVEQAVFNRKKVEEKGLCYLCGKRLEPDESESRVCISCRA